MVFAPFDLSGKAVLITGGNSGIGLGMAEGLAEAGADIVIWGTDPRKNADARERLQKHGTKVAALQCSVNDEAAVESCFNETVEFLGSRLDACFANAGIPGRRHRSLHFDQMPLDDWRNVFAVNLDGVFLTLRKAAGHMRQTGTSGSLCVTSSIAGEYGSSSADYGASKGAVNALVKALAVEYGPAGIRANAILPGWVETPFTEKVLASEEFTARRDRRIPVRRWGRPRDFAAIAIYLASDGSSFHSGDMITLDGAYTMCGN